MSNSRLFTQAAVNKSDVISPQAKTVADEITQRIKEQIGMIAGSKKFIDAFTALSEMVNDPQLQSESVQDIINAWEKKTNKSGTTYHDVLYASVKHSDRFLSEAVDFMFDQQEFVKKIQLDIGSQYLNAAIQKSTIEYK